MQAEELMHLMQVVMMPKAATLIQSCDRVDRNGTTTVFHCPSMPLRRPLRCTWWQRCCQLAYVAKIDAHQLTISPLYRRSLPVSRGEYYRRRSFISDMQLCTCHLCVLQVNLQSRRYRVQLNGLSKWAWPAGCAGTFSSSYGRSKMDLETQSLDIAQSM
jgi:hypothetical protein